MNIAPHPANPGDTPASKKTLFFASRLPWFKTRIFQNNAEWFMTFLHFREKISREDAHQTFMKNYHSIFEQKPLSSSLSRYLFLNPQQLS